MPSYVVTGASRGLGFGLVKSLALDPSNTVIGLARNVELTKDRLERDGVTNVHVLAADITDEAALRDAASETREILQGKGLDVLLNNAGYISEISHLKGLDEFESEVETVVDDTHKSFEINVIGVLRTVYAFLPLIQAGKEKKVVAISSGHGDIDFVNKLGIFQGAPYAISKASLSILFAKLQASYRDQRILFFSICPGAVDTAEGPPSLSAEDRTRLERMVAVFQKYDGPVMANRLPTEAAKGVLALVQRSSLEKGYGGSFLSHNGTQRWLEPGTDAY